MAELPLDEVGYWSEIKLDIVPKYSGGLFNDSFLAQKLIKGHVYIDAFCRSRPSYLRSLQGKFIPGSPMNAATR